MLFRSAKMADAPTGAVPPMLAPFVLPHQWDAVHAAKLASLSDTEPMTELLRKVSADGTAISDALSQRYFSHAHGAHKTVGA